MKKRKNIENKMSPARRAVTGSQAPISPSARQILREIASLEAIGAQRDLTPGEAEAKRRLAVLFLDLPEIAPAVGEALAELEKKAGLSWEVREHIIERFEDALLKFPDAALSMARLKGLMRHVTHWGVGRFARVGKNSNGDYILEHPGNAARLDGVISRGEESGTTLHEVAESPASVDLIETVMAQDRIGWILKYAEGEGPEIHRTVIRVMLGWKYREIAEVEEVSENAIAKRLERFRKILSRYGV